MNTFLKDIPLAKQINYVSTYDPKLLFTIPRIIKRQELGIHEIPFTGNDIWNAFELSWLNSKGKPVVAAAEFNIPCESSHLIESKSFKLYLNSFNNTVFDSFASVQNILITDLSKAAGSIISVKLFPLSSVPPIIKLNLNGKLLDELDIACDTYQTDPSFLSTDDTVMTETLCSHLLKSNCLVTGQPDWGSIQITYTGNKINHEGLLKYIVSFRNHEEFHEQCIERIFIDIANYCAPDKLLVYARYTRRGGIDINPYRANYPVKVENIRLWRQ